MRKKLMLTVGMIMIFCMALSISACEFNSKTTNGDVDSTDTTDDSATTTKKTTTAKTTTTAKPDPVYDAETSASDISKAGYNLIFNDEFSGDSLDETKWTYEINGDGGGNNEKQYYLRDNLTVGNGFMTITARRQPYSNKNFTSSRINTKDKFEFCYGYIETRMALPNINGLWPAFWMLGANFSEVGWPNCGEIDIMESVNSDRKILGTCHWGPYVNGGHPNYGQNRAITDPTEYHVYSCEWTSSQIKCMVDGVQYFVIAINNDLGEYFREDFFLIYNLAVGGSLTGNKIPATADLPATFRVDYVRVYQRA